MDMDNEQEATAALEALLRATQPDLAEPLFEYCRTKRVDGTSYVEALAAFAQQIYAGDDAAGVRAWITIDEAGASLRARLTKELTDSLVTRFGGGKPITSRTPSDIFEAVVDFFKRHVRDVCRSLIRPACQKYVRLGNDFEIGSGRIFSVLWAQRAFPMQAPAERAAPPSTPKGPPKLTRRERRAKAAKGRRQAARA